MNSVERMRLGLEKMNFDGSWLTFRTGVIVRIVVRLLVN
jgi:hypothetical protein